MTFEQITQEIESAGFAWALERHPGRDYLAVVEIEAEANYIGDGLAYFPKSGSTPAEALAAAFEQAKLDQKE